MDKREFENKMEELKYFCDLEANKLRAGDISPSEFMDWFENQAENIGAKVENIQSEDVWEGYFADSPLYYIWDDSFDPNSTNMLFFDAIDKKCEVNNLEDIITKKELEHDIKIGW